MRIVKVGQRLYVEGSTYSMKDALKSLGCHWDADRKQWWIGKAKQAALEKIVSGAGESTGYVAPTAEQLAEKDCLGKVECKGRNYYVVGRSDRTGKLLLTVLDCSISFWTSEYRWIKHYDRDQTVGGIRRFIERSKRDDAEIKSGQIPAGYCVDLEDGMVKRLSECDIPAN